MQAWWSETIDFDGVRRCDKLQIFVSATHVEAGRLRIFRQRELTADVVLASACLPLLFEAVEIDGEACWDGGFAGNPSLLPLITESPADDLLLVQINPHLRESVATTASDILDRMDEVTFNTSLLKELRSIALLKQLIEAEGRPGHRYREVTFQRVEALRVHRIDGGGHLAQPGASLFVVAFAVFPIAAALFREAQIPGRLIPATIALGAFIFTMTALPGTPAIQNAIPMPFLGATPFAARGLGLIGGAGRCAQLRARLMAVACAGHVVPGRCPVWRHVRSSRAVAVRPPFGPGRPGFCGHLCSAGTARCAPRA